MFVIIFMSLVTTSAVITVTYVAANNLVSIRKYGPVKLSILISRLFSGYIRMRIISTKQRLTNSVVRLDSKNHEVNYVLGGKLYKVIVTSVRGPHPIFKIYGVEDGGDVIEVTDRILPYFGPQRNWSGCIYRPNTFGLKKMSIYLSNGDVRLFEHDEILDITKYI